MVCATSPSPWPHYARNKSGLTDDDSDSASGDGDNADSNIDRSSVDSAGSDSVDSAGSSSDDIDNAGSADQCTHQTGVDSNADNGACANVVAISGYGGPYG